MILYFNPTCEMAVRHDGMNYTPPLHVARMETDLSTIMMFLAEDGDKVVANAPDPELLNFWATPLTQGDFISVDEARRRIANGEKLTPWGQCRSVMTKFGLAGEARRWTLRRTLSRETSVAVEQRLADILGEASPSTLLSTKEALETALRTRLASGGAVLKSLWSASGRGVRIYNDDGDLAAALVFGQNCIAADGAVVVECRLDRVMEFSFLFTFGCGKADYLGVNPYHSSTNGTFGHEVIDSSAFDILNKSIPGWERIYVPTLARALEEELSGIGYEGPIGVDAMVHRDHGGRERLRCCMEVNVRHCMGHVARAVGRHFAQNAVARWGVVSFAHDGQWDEFCATEAEKHPAKRDAMGRVVDGFFRLTSLGRDKRFGACGWASLPHPVA